MTIKIVAHGNGSIEIMGNSPSSNSTSRKPKFHPHLGSFLQFIDVQIHGVSTVYMNGLKLNDQIDELKSCIQSVRYNKKWLRKHDIVKSTTDHVKTIKVKCHGIGKIDIMNPYFLLHPEIEFYIEEKRNSTRKIKCHGIEKVFAICQDRNASASVQSKESSFTENKSSFWSPVYTSSKQPNKMESNTDSDISLKCHGTGKIQILSKLSTAIEEATELMEAVCIEKPFNDKDISAIPIAQEVKEMKTSKCPIEYIDLELDCHGAGNIQITLPAFQSIVIQKLKINVHGCGKINVNILENYDSI